MISRGSAATVGLVSAGLILRLLQLFNGRSLWKDEASLAVSIVERSLVQLVKTPLEYNQVAPPLYLMLAKLSTLLLGSSEFALRLPSFLCSAASLLLFVVLARQVAEGAAFYAALAMFAFSPLLIEYAGEAKPYSADALGALAVVLCAMRMLRPHLTSRDAVSAAVSVRGRMAVACAR